MHGFRYKSSCLTSLLDFFAQVKDTNDKDNNNAVDLVDPDFQKAFDKLPHERLMVKVNAHCIQGDAIRWIRNWFTGRRKRVYINHHIATGHQSHLVLKASTISYLYCPQNI